MTRVIFQKVVIFAVAMALILYPAPPAKAARFEELRISNLGDDLVVYLKVRGAFKKDMKEAVMSGVKTTFFFLITLKKVRDFLPDKSIASVTLTHSLKYHSLKNEFVVRRSWEENALPDGVVVETFDEARERMSEIDNISLIPLNMLKKGEKYQLRAKAEMGKITLPFYLHYVLFFVSMWDFETDWYAIDFTY
jgi:hypothetical protein